MQISEEAAFWRLTAMLLAFGFGLLILFVAWPDLDIWAAALFHDGENFAAGQAWPARWLRAIYHLIFMTMCAAAVVGLLGALLRTQGRRTPPVLWLFAALLFLIGPGLLANTILKDNWGRARPAYIAEFGGDRTFTLPFQISDECARNCSFVSGEGSTAAAVAAVVVALFWPLLRGPFARIIALAALGLWHAGAAYIRMAPGRHFLSDTLIAFVLMGLVSLALYAVLGVGHRAHKASPAAMAHDLRVIGLDFAARLAGLARRAIWRLRR
jgi:lipid A 4'-phosphatase